MKLLDQAFGALKNVPLTFSKLNIRKTLYFARRCLLRSSSVNGEINIQELRSSCNILPSWSMTLAEGKRILQEKHGFPQKINNFSSLLPLKNVIRRLQSAEDNNAHLINTVKNLAQDHDDSTQWPGLVTLLLAKAAGSPFAECSFNNRNSECDNSWESQMMVADIINLLCKSITFQKKYERLGLRQKVRKGRIQRDVTQMIHHYFISEVLFKMGTLNNCKAVWLISGIMESLAEANCGEYPSEINCDILRTLDDWESYTFYPQGILLANGCQAALELSGHGSTVQKMACEFAQNLVFALKAHSDIHHFMQFHKSEISYFRLNALPVVLHLQDNPELLYYIYSRGGVLDNLDHSVIYSAVNSGSSLSEANKILQSYIEESIKILREFKSSLEKNNLIKLAESLKDVHCKSFSIIPSK